MILILSLVFAVTEPASNLQVLEAASKSMRVTWDASIGDISGYKLQMIPMMAGMKRQELYVGPTQTSAVVRDLSPDTEYQISLFALKGLMPSEPVVAMQKTEPVKVSLGEYKNTFDFYFLLHFGYLLNRQDTAWSLDISHQTKFTIINLQ